MFTSLLKMEEIAHALRRILAKRIETEARKLATSLEVEPSVVSFDCDPSASAHEITVDDDFETEHQRFLVESEGIHQERFNIQEAFTNQTKKLQADYQAFLDQLNADFDQERQKIISQSSDTEIKGSVVPPEIPTTAQLDKQFKSKVKRHMLIQTAPVVHLCGSDQGVLATGKLSRNSSSLDKNDMTQVHHRLQELEHRLAAFKEGAEERLKDGMQWIARQCAHMFSQLDCKE